MKIISALSVVLFLASPIVVAQTSGVDREAVETRGRINGRFWRMAGNSARISIVAGLQEGLILWRDTGNKIEASDHLIEGFSIAEIVDQIDKFYSDSANIRVPISWAYGYANRKMTGAKDEASLQEYAKFLRELWAEKSPQP
jgi:hypothetical protein